MQTISCLAKWLLTRYKPKPYIRLTNKIVMQIAIGGPMWILLSHLLRWITKVLLIMIPLSSYLIVRSEQRNVSSWTSFLREYRWTMHTVYVVEIWTRISSQECSGKMHFCFDGNINVHKLPDVYISSSMTPVLGRGMGKTGGGGVRRSVIDLDNLACWVEPFLTPEGRCSRTDS